VEAVNHLGPQLSARDTVLLWDGDGSSPLRPPWVVADIAKKEFTFASRGQQIRRVALLKDGGYQIVFSRDGYLVLHRRDARQATETANVLIRLTLVGYEPAVFAGSSAVVSTNWA